MNAVPQQTSGDKTAIRPFQVNVSEAKIAKLRSRIDATEWPDRETVADESQGVPLATMQELARYYQAPRSWTERAYQKLIYYNKADQGGHYAAWEQPELFSQEIRAGLRPLRK